jgi:acetyl-CoA C-acetyltransferase/acetyl-CoA acyltransferase
VDVAVIGVGQTKFGNLYDMGRKELFSEAFWEALGDIPKGLDPREIEEAYIGTMETGGAQLGNIAALMVEQVQLPHIPARRIENACASSGFALRDASLAIKSGRRNIVLAAGPTGSGYPGMWSGSGWRERTFRVSMP